MAATAKRRSKRARAANQKPLVIITGAAGNLGQSVGNALRADYQVVGFDLRTPKSGFPIIGMDLTSGPAVELALRNFGDAFGSKIASVLHLAAYFDFNGEDSDLYEKVDVEGTRKLLRSLRDFEVDQFIYSSTMLVHAPCRPGEHIDENQPIEPRMRRRVNAGQNWLRVLLVGGTDEMPDAGKRRTTSDEFDRPPGAIFKEMVAGGVGLPWNLGISALIGVSLLFTRLTLGTDGSLANAHHLIGALVLTVVSVAAAEVARPVRYVNAVLGAALLIVPFVCEADVAGATMSVMAGVALIGLSFRHGPIRERYGNWNRLLV